MHIPKGTGAEGAGGPRSRAALRQGETQPKAVVGTSVYRRLSDKARRLPPTPSRPSLHSILRSSSASRSKSARRFTKFHLPNLIPGTPLQPVLNLKSEARVPMRARRTGVESGEETHLAGQRHSRRAVCCAGGSRGH